jgi:hypothetical protein
MEIIRRDGPLQDRIRFSDAEIAAVRKALKSKLFRADEADEVRLAKFQTMLDELGDLFSIPAPKLVKHGGDGPGYVYDADANAIHVQRFSLVTVLDGFAHALQARTENGEVSGEFVMAFGLSAFKAAAPRMFELARGSGRLMGVDVPYTDAGRRPAAALPRGLPRGIIISLLGGMQPMRRIHEAEDEG